MQPQNIDCVLCAHESIAIRKHRLRHQTSRTYTSSFPLVPSLVRHILAHVPNKDETCGKWLQDKRANTKQTKQRSMFQHLGYTTSRYSEIAGQNNYHLWYCPNSVPKEMCFTFCWKESIPLPNDSSAHPQAPEPFLV